MSSELEFILLLVCISYLIAASFYVGTRIGDLKEYYSEIFGKPNETNIFFNTSNSHITNLSICGNQSLEHIANCLKDYLTTFYNYTILPDKRRTLEEIKQNGGDCYDYSNLYADWGKELGVYGKVVIMDNDNESAHAIAILSNSEGYCMMEQTNKPICLTFVQANKSI
jgi:hypothetical protein